VAADLGTWPAEQATVLLEVLHASGLNPEARRGRDGVHVTVPDEEGDRAHATLVAQMDTIARAARPSPPTRGRRLRAVDSPESGRPTKRAKPSRPKGGKDPSRRSAARAHPSGGGDRVKRLSSPVAIAVLGFGAAFVLAAGGENPTFPLALMTGGLVWVLGKRAERGL
jgi:hypothetical protein